MRYKKLKLCTMLILVIGLKVLQAQEVIPAAGSTALGSGGSVCYTVGQIVYQTHTGIDGSVSEGVQQPYEISVIPAIEETEGIHFSASVYPNPSIDYLTLEVEEFELLNLTYHLFNMQGQPLQSKKITENITIIAMEKLMTATYYLKVTHKNIELKTFKIIKKQFNH